MSDRQLFIQRVVHAPRQLVFKMWTDPEHMPKWWGPNGFTNTVHSMDARTGGFCDYTMHGPDGKDWPNYQSYKEIIPNEKIEYMHGSSAEDVFRGCRTGRSIFCLIILCNQMVTLIFVTK